MSENGKRQADQDGAATRVLQAIFDDDYIYEETFRRIKADPEPQATLDRYNKACVEYDAGDMDVETFNELENRYYEEVYGPMSVAVAREVLQRAAELAQYAPYGPKEKNDV